MIKSSASGERRKAACLADYLLCFAGVDLFGAELGYFLFVAAFILSVLIYEIAAVAVVGKTLGLALFGFQVKFIEPADRFFASLKRSLIFCWHVFVVFWPEEPAHAAQQKTEQGLIVYKWESGCFRENSLSATSKGIAKPSPSS